MWKSVSLKILSAGVWDVFRVDISNVRGVVVGMENAEEIFQVVWGESVGDGK